MENVLSATRVMGAGVMTRYVLGYERLRLPPRMTGPRHDVRIRSRPYR